MKTKPVLPQTNIPKQNIPYSDINQKFRFGFIVPGKGIKIEKDSNGVLYISTESGGDVADLVAGDNIDLKRTEDGKIIISAVNTVTDIAAGQNVTITIDPNTGTAVINSIVGEDESEHYKGVFETAEDLIAADPEPEEGDYGLIQKVTYSDGGEMSWNGEYKYCFFINGGWQVVDQMLTFTSDDRILKRYYSVGGGSPVIYLHEVARTGDFNDLKNVPIVATPEVTVEGSTVTATCSTEGAEIYYTTDGSMPSAASNHYTGPITAGAATTFRFVAVKNGMINSLEAVASADYELQAPTITLDYTTGEVTMTNPNVDGNDDPVGSIFYTTDGSTPTAASVQYTEPFVITSQRDFRAIVINTGDSKASPVTAQYFRKMYFTGHSGGGSGIAGTENFFISPDPNTGVVKFTNDGSTPDFNSPILSETQVIPYYGGMVRYNCIAYGEGRVPSNLFTTTRGTNERPVSPVITLNTENDTISLVEGTNADGTRGYITGLYGNVSLIPGNDHFNSRIYYTLDSTTPTANSTMYTAPFQVREGQTVKAILIAFGEYESAVVEQTIHIVEPPVSQLDYMHGEIVIDNFGGEGDIYYTLDGSTPTAESTKYVDPIRAEGPVDLKMVVITNDSQSRIVEVEYEQAPAPEIKKVDYNEKTGTYSIVMKADPSESIHFTTDGSTPDEGSEVFVDAIEHNEFDGDIRYKAINFVPDMIPSQITEYESGKSAVDAPEITVDANDMVTILLTGNTVNIPLQTNENVPAMGARIYYTTDGTDPVTDGDRIVGTLYTGPFPYRDEDFSALKAVTVCYGQYISSIGEFGLTPPEISLDYTNGEVTLTNNNIVGTIHYTDDGTTPTAASPVYNGPFVPNSQDVFAIVVYDDIVSSAAHGWFTYASGVYYMEAPILSENTVSVEFSFSSGTKCTYTTDGTDPDYNSTSAGYMQRIKVPYVGQVTTIKYRFFKEGYLPSPVYTNQVGVAQLGVPTISFDADLNSVSMAHGSPWKGEYMNIYYTTDGSTPTKDNGSIYSSTFSISETKTIKAVQYYRYFNTVAWQYEEIYSEVVSQECIFNPLVAESDLADNDVALIYKRNSDGELRYLNVDDAALKGNIDTERYTLKDFIRFERGKNGRSVAVHKTGIGWSQWARNNEYVLTCDLTADGGFDWSVVINGYSCGGTVSWLAANDPTLSEIVAQLNAGRHSSVSADYLSFTVSGDEIHIVQRTYSASALTITNATGANLDDLSFYCRINGVDQAQTHRTWQAEDVHTLFPDSGFLPANTVQYAKNGYNMSYICGGNLAKFKSYYRVSGSGHGGVDSYVAEDSLSGRMSEVGFASLNGSGVAEQQALYDKYDGSWDAYMEASMIKINSTETNGIEYQSYDDGDVQSQFLNSVTTKTFGGEWVNVYTMAHLASQLSDPDLGAGNMPTEHELAVLVSHERMNKIDQAINLIGGGILITNSDYYWSVAQCTSNCAWLFRGSNGLLDDYTKYSDVGGRALAYLND